MPWMAPTWHYSIDTGYGNYHALLVGLQKRFSNSLNSIVSYTWSKSLDNSSGWFEAENGTGGGSVVQHTASRRTTCGITSRGARFIRFRSGRGRGGFRRGLLHTCWAGGRQTTCSRSA